MVPTEISLADSADVHHKIGQLTRQLHDSLNELGYAEKLRGSMGELPDAQSRLSYIARLTGEAAEKVLNLRIFSDAQGKFNHSALEVGADILAVSQFTLYADTSRGRRPGFSTALEPGKADELFKLFVSELMNQGAKRVETGEFGAHMVVSLENDGPVTILLES